MNIRFHSRIARWWLDSQDGYILFTEWSDSSSFVFLWVTNQSKARNASDRGARNWSRRCEGINSTTPRFNSAVKSHQSILLDRLLIALKLCARHVAQGNDCCPTWRLRNKEEAYLGKAWILSLDIMDAPIYNIFIACNTKN